MWNWNSLETLLQDVRFGLRQLRRSPGFTITAVLTLALGIGANTALFSVVNGVLLNPLPFPQPRELVTIHETKPNFDLGSISYPNFLDWQRDNHSFSAVAAYRAFGFNVTGTGRAEQVSAELVTSGFFPLLGVKPVIGRTFAPKDDLVGAGPVAMISEGYWERKFSSAPDAVGKSLTLDGKDYTVIGVIPASFHLFIPSFRETDIYAPIIQWSNPLLLHRDSGLGIHGIGRLRGGVTVEQARADMERVTRNLAAVYPDADTGIGAALVPLREAMVGRVQPYLLMLLAAVGFVLLIACVNVANLLLARSTGRTREFAIRAALGAGRARVIRQLLTESVLVALAGGGLGALFAGWGTRAALSQLPLTNGGKSALPRAEAIGLDSHVLLFIAAISLLTGILAGLAPALRTSGTTLHEMLQEGGRGASGRRHRAHGAFVVLEMAMALVLLIGAGLMVRSLVRLWNLNPGFEPHHVLTFNVGLDMDKASPDAIRAGLRQIDRNLESIPGVQAVSMSWGAFPLYTDDEALFWLEGQPKPSTENEEKWTLKYVVEPGYFQAMGLALERGRFLTSQDNELSAPVMVVDDFFARQLFPGQDPIGKRLNLEGYSQPLQIVGVVRHVKQWGLDSDDAQPLRAQAYFSLMQLPDNVTRLVPSQVAVVVRAAGAPLALAEPIRSTLRQMNIDDVYGLLAVDELVSRSLGPRRFAMTLLGTFAAFALILASVGIYGVVSHLVGQRTYEFGVRMALGARRADVLRVVLGQGAKMALVGVALGLGAAFGLTRLLATYSMLFGISATDPITFAVVSVLLTLVALVASYIPALRATKVDPMTALRYE
jgi:predicted permease